MGLGECVLQVLHGNEAERRLNHVATMVLEDQVERLVAIGQPLHSIQWKCVQHARVEAL